MASAKEVNSRGGESVTLNPGSSIWNLLEIEEPNQAAFEAKVKELRHLADIGQDTIKALRQEVNGLIIKLDGVHEQPASRGLLTVVDSADLSTLNALKSEYTRRLEELLPAQCAECGSVHLSRRSSVAGMQDTRARRQKTFDPDHYA